MKLKLYPSQIRNSRVSVDPAIDHLCVSEAVLDLHGGNERFRNRAVNKEGVEAKPIRGNQPIPLALAKLHKCPQRSPAKVSHARAGFHGVSVEVVSVGHSHTQLGSKDVLILQDHDARLNHGERFPDPVINAVQVEREDINEPGESVASEKVINCASCYPGVLKHGRVNVGGWMLGEEPSPALNQGQVPVHHEPVEAVVDHKVGCVVLLTIPGANLDALPISEPSHREQVKQNAVFIGLGINPEPGVLNARALGTVKQAQGFLGNRARTGLLDEFTDRGLETGKHGVDDRDRSAGGLQGS
jgi:hypothetical protein